MLRTIVSPQKNGQKKNLKTVDTIPFNIIFYIFFLFQILPNLVEGEWENCLCFVSRMYNLHKLLLTDRIQDVKCETLIDFLGKYAKIEIIHSNVVV